MADTTFVKMTPSERLFPGNPMIILTGFKPKEQLLFLRILKKLNLTIPVVFPGDAEGDDTLNTINSFPKDSGKGERSTLPRAVIACGITEKAFHRLLERYKQGSLPRPLWATLTETSQQWTLNSLLQELSRERASMG